ncbi:hypothetical protein EJB05_01716, partial [Eragrostis curvula]
MSAEDPLQALGAAMEIVTGALSTTLPKLAVLLTDEYKLQKSLRGEIMFLEAELEAMQAALERISETPVTDNQVKVWARDVRELSYDIEDSIDIFMVRVRTCPSATLNGFRGFMNRAMNLLTTAKVRHQIATDIKVFRALVKEVAGRHDRYKIDSAAVAEQSSTNLDPRLQGMYEESTRLVGLGSPREELSKMLLMGQESMLRHQLIVIPIVGIGGLGKTTLANVMYQQLRAQFDCHAFVSVSLKPDLKRILSSILRQVTNHGCTNIETWDIPELINNIRKFLEDKRYFVIIDDIWNELAWTQIRCALIDNNCGSKIITTTRILAVATSCCSGVEGTIYKLKHLSHEDSKKLFNRRIFGTDNNCHPELKEISEKILKKCDGVPLAIITISSLLANKPRNYNLWYNVHNSIGSGHEKSSGVENMRQILSISYYDLPSHLKACLLYLSILPEDHSITKDLLVRRWIAEGLIQGDHMDLMHQLGVNYFNELMNRSMIQPSQMYDHGRVEACCVHDMVLDLITSLSTEENFVTNIDSQRPNCQPRKIRRLALQSSEDNTTPQFTMNLSHVRSLIVFPPAVSLIPPLSCFHILRVLDFEGCRDLKKHQIDGIGNLVHLRYLGLKDTNITNLPKEIGKLHCLQTLELRHTSIRELPPTIVQLTQLMHLYIDRAVKLPDGIGKLDSLQVLSFVGVSISPNFAKELGHLIELRVLQILLLGDTWDKSYEKPLVNSLCNLRKVHELDIEVKGVLSTEFMADIGWVPQHLCRFTGVTLSRLPRWISSSLLCLSYLHIKRVKRLGHEDVQNLGALPFLHYLYLSVVEVITTDEILSKCIIDHAKFQSLAEFDFHNDALGLMFTQEAMPRLETIEITFKASKAKNTYGDFDLGLQNLSSLKYVIVRIDCSGSSIFEVAEADAAMRKAIAMNPNYPKLDVIRYFEDEMIEHEGGHRVHEETTEEEEQQQATIPDKVGPWGGDGGRARNVKVAPHRLRSLKICCGDVIDALAFSYEDRHGKQHTTPLWGGVGGWVRTIHLGPSEILTEVSGTTGPYDSPYGRISEVVTSLRLVTNVHTYGPFGKPRGNHFSAPTRRNSSVVAFHARSGQYVDAIGVYLSPMISGP